MLSELSEYSKQMLPHDQMELTALVEDADEVTSAHCCNEVGTARVFGGKSCVGLQCIELKCSKEN